MAGSGRSPADESFDHVVGEFSRRFGERPTLVARAPGRVNLLGSHTDYNDGWVLPVAIDRYVWMAAGPTAAAESTIASLDYTEEVTLSVARLDRSGEHLFELLQRPLPLWSKYVYGVAWALIDSALSLPEMRAVFHGSVPIGSGLSSSAALTVAAAKAWIAVAGETVSRCELALITQRAEHEVVGIKSGIMDQYASLFGRDDSAILLDCRSLEHRPIALPDGLEILVADTGVRRQLADSKYNERRRECHSALNLVKEQFPGTGSLRDIAPEQLVSMRSMMPATLYRRAMHVSTECRRVLEGSRLLAQNELGAFGRLMGESHASSRDLYEVSIAELDLLCEAAASSEHCIGARMTGAGFGGSVVALVRSGHSAEIDDVMSSSFEERFGVAPQIHRCRPSASASISYIT